jgi:CubicO group peptidase (beta-lactamase class C family)
MSKEEEILRQKVIEFNNYIKTGIVEDWVVDAGLAVAVFDGDKDEPLYYYTCGYANTETKRKLQITDKFCVASCGKGMLCLAISIAIEKKDIPDVWDMKLSDPRLFGKDIHNDFHNVPVKWIASHQSGIHDSGVAPKKFLKREEKYDSLDDIDLRYAISNDILKIESIYKPGSKKSYSNDGYGILGSIVEKLSGKSYEEFMQKYVFTPLSIRIDNDKYHMGPGYAEGHLYNPYYMKKPIPLTKDQWFDPVFEAPAGHAYLNILESVKYLQQYLKAYRDDSDALFSNAIYTKQTTPLIDNYGLAMANKDGKVGHSGGWFATKTLYHMIPSKNIGLVIEKNDSHSGLSVIIKKFDEIFG